MNNEQKYWMVAYQYKDYGITNQLVDIHPVEWIVKTNDEYDGQYKLHFFTEVPKGIFDKFEGHMG